MRHDFIGIFDVIGPVMVGPSSSHTSGAATIAWMARQIFSENPQKVTFTLYGSFAETYMGHGTDRALIGGTLGYKPDDMRIRHAYEHAEEAGVEVEFNIDRDTEVSHPNTVDIVMTRDDHTLLIRGESVGGGRVRIRRINTIEVDFTGEYSTIIIGHQDKKGVISFITTFMAEQNINIASLRLYREAKGKDAFAIIETDDYITQELEEMYRRHQYINSVDLIEI